MEIMTALLANQSVNGRPVTTACTSYLGDGSDLVLRTSVAVVIVAVVLAVLALIGP
jgi:hypothetical protein